MNESLVNMQANAKAYRGATPTPVAGAPVEGAG